MTANTEFWLCYHQVSRAHCPSTAQLVELDFQNHKLLDLEDVLEYVFRQGYVEARHRPCTWWERKDGVRIKGSHVVEDLLKEGVGRCQNSALKLVIADIPPALWFSYVNVQHPGAQTVVQRVRIDTPTLKLDKLAHVTNYIFDQGYLLPKFRSAVYWQTACGKPIQEHVSVVETLEIGEGISEDKPLRLVIDHPTCYRPVAHPCGCHH